MEVQKTFFGTDQLIILWSYLLFVRTLGNALEKSLFNARPNKEFNNIFEMIPIPFHNFDEHHYQPCFINNFSYPYPPQSFEQNMPIIYYLPQVPQWVDLHQTSCSSPTPTIEPKDSDGSLFEPEFQSNLPKEKKEKKERFFRPKKNVESNISNQVFSYITNNHKSKEALMRIFKEDHRKVEAFYTYIDIFTRTKKKYLSRKYLGELCVLSESREEIQVIKKKKKDHVLSIHEFRTAISLLIFHYLREKCVLNILTSVKLSSELRIEHLKRRRQVLNYLEEYVKPDYRFK